MKKWGLLILLLMAAGFAWDRAGWPIWSAAPLPYETVLGTPGDIREQEPRPDLALLLAWNREGTRLLAKQRDGTVTAWDTRSGQSTPLARTQSVFAYCPARDQLLVNVDDAAVLLSLGDGAFLRLSDGRHDHAAFSADCSTIAIAREDETEIRLWRDQVAWSSVAAAQPVRNSLMLSDNGAFLAAAGGTYTDAEGHRTTLEIFALGDGEARRTVLLANPDEILGMWSMAFAPDGTGLMLGSQVHGQSGLRHILSDTGDVRWGHDGFSSHWVRALAVSPDGIVLATGDENGLLRLWDVETGTKLAEFRSEQVIQSLAFSADGRSLAIGLSDGTIGISSVKALLAL